MPAEDRARKPGALPSAPDETGVSMRALLASCAAADAVSTPPSDTERAGGAEPGSGDEMSSRGAGDPRAHSGQDAA